MEHSNIEALNSPTSLSILDSMGRDIFPIMNLPEELFAKILKMSLGDRAPQLLHKRRKRERGVVYWRSGPPITYALVCKSWEKSVYSTPQLWSSIKLNSNHLRIGDAVLRLFVNWLARAGTSPLTIELQMESALDHPNRLFRNLDVIMAFIDVLYSKQVQHLTIIFPPGPVASTLPKRISVALRDAHLLESVSLKVPGGSSNFDPQSTITFDHGVPKLKTLKCAPWLSYVQLLSRQVSLTELDLRSRVNPLEISLIVLTNAPNVEKVEMTIDFQSISPISMVSLSHLRELSILFPYPSMPMGREVTWDDFFSRIHAPKLSKLTVKDWNSRIEAGPQAAFVVPHNHEWRNLETLLADSSHPPIVESSLIDVAVEGNRLRSALSMTTNLVVLKLIRLRCIDDMARALKVRSGGPGGGAAICICPRLEDIRIEIPKGPVYDHVRVARMLY